jgi:hypothetical protein
VDNLKLCNNECSLLPYPTPSVTDSSLDFYSNQFLYTININNTAAINLHQRLTLSNLQVVLKHYTQIQTPKLPSKSPATCAKKSTNYSHADAQSTKKLRPADIGPEPTLLKKLAIMLMIEEFDG